MRVSDFGNEIRGLVEWAGGGGEQGQTQEEGEGGGKERWGGEGGRKRRGREGGGRRDGRCASMADREYIEVRFSNSGTRK